MDPDKLAEIWKQYGKRYNVFVPEDQPTPEGQGWNRPLPEPGNTESFPPEVLQHWRLFGPVKRFLRHRYAEHGILQSPSLTFDCLVPKFQAPMRISGSKSAARKAPADPPEWYADAIRMVMTKAGEVGFVCRSEECLRTRCKLNRQNRLRRHIADVFTLIQIFHAYRSPAKAKSVVAEAFCVQFGHFDFKNIEPKSPIVRYAVPKWAVRDLIRRYAGMRRQQVSSLVKDATELIRSAQQVELPHTRVFSHYFAFFWPQILDNQVLQAINGPAIRLYLWLLVEQEERARRNEFAMKLKDAEIARRMGISPKTAGSYRQDLEKLGLLMVRKDRYAVGYRPKSRRNT